MMSVRSDPKFRDHVLVSIHPRAHRWYREALHSAFHDTAPSEARSFLSVQRGFVTRRDRAERIVAWARALRFFRDPPADPAESDEEINK